MPKYATPTCEGYWWAKLAHPTRMPLGEDWASPDWEIVRVFVNDTGGKVGEEEYLGVSMGGISPCQWVDDFVWGPPVKDRKPLSGDHP